MLQEYFVSYTFLETQFSREILKKICWKDSIFKQSNSFPAVLYVLYRCILNQNFRY